jgi:hypothetical protein
MFAKTLWLAIPCLFSSLALACAQTDRESQLIATWRVNVSQTVEYHKSHGHKSDFTDRDMSELNGVTVEFSKDGNVSVRRAEGDSTGGTWKFVGEENSTAKIQMIRNDEITETTIEFLDDDTIAITPGQEPTLVFKRVTSARQPAIATRLWGTWTFDREATAASEVNKDFTQEQVDQMLGEVSQMVVTFRENGTFVALTRNGDEPTEITGNWSARDADEAKQTFEVQLDTAGVPKIIRVRLLDDGKVLFAPVEEPAAIFAPKPAQPKTVR